MEETVNQNTEVVKEKKKVRYSNFDILKIIAFIMVVCYHYLDPANGKGLVYAANNPITLCIFNVTQSLCACAVPVFLLITGYFSWKNTSFSLNKIFGLFIMKISYKIICYLIDILIMRKAFDGGFFALCFVPDNYYINLYAVMMFFSPLINKLFKLNKRNILTIVGVFTLIFVAFPTIIDLSFSIANYPTIIGLSFLSDSGDIRGYTIIAFIFYYILGGSIHLFDFKTKKYFLFILFVVFITLITILLYKTRAAIYYNNIFVAAASTSIFLLFKNIKIKESAFLREISSCSLGVFLLHTTGLFIYDFNSIFNIEKNVELNTWSAVGNMLLVVMSTVVVCAISDYIIRLAISPLKKKLYSTKFMNYKIIEVD